MTSFVFSMRWWLALAFALVAAVGAVASVAFVSDRSETAVRRSAEELAIGRSVVVANQTESASSRRELRWIVRAAANLNGLALFVFDANGRLLTGEVSHGVRLADVPLLPAARETAIGGRRFLRSTRDGTATVFAVPLRRGIASALVSYSVRPEVRTQLDVVRDELGPAAFWATLLGAGAGLVLALLIVARLRRIARVAEAIEGGQLGVPVRVGFPDEIGGLARSIERMRARLHASFALLASDRDRLEQLLAGLHEGVVAVTSGLEVEFMNERARVLLPAQVEPGAALPDVWPELPLREFAESLFQPAGRLRQVQVSPDESRTFTVTGLPAAGGRAIIVIADVSERERVERAQRDFSTNAAHELRTPITAILSSVELLQLGAKDEPAERDEFLRHIEREAARLARLSRSLLVLARAQAGEEPPQRVPVELAPLLEGVAAALEVPGEVRVRVSAAPGVAALADAALVEQALGAVAANAARHTARGEIVLAARAAGDRVVVSVSDTGTGVPRAQQGRIFDRFYRGSTRDQSGFGIGLSIAREAMRVMDGEIELVSTPGQGTSVTFALPGFVGGSDGKEGRT